MLTNTIIKDIKPEQRIPIQEKLFSEGNRWHFLEKINERFVSDFLIISYQGKLFYSSENDLEEQISERDGCKVITADEYLEEKKEFEPNKNAKELGIDTSRVFEVIKGNDYCVSGDILILNEDDKTPSPLFRKIGKKETFFVNWSRLKYAEDQTVEEPKEKPDKIDKPFFKAQAINLLELSKTIPEESDRLIDVAISLIKKL